MPPPLVALALVLALAAGSRGDPATSPAAGAVEHLGRPVGGEVVAGFDAPSRYGPGHRGVDLAVPPGTPVVAPAGGTVAFAGTVVGSRWVTVDHGRLRSTVGPLSTIEVRAGDVVTGGARLGRSGRAHGLAAVHWSVRRGDAYVDPLAAAAPRVTTLVPADRTPAPAAREGAPHAPPVGDPWRGRVR